MIRRVISGSPRILPFVVLMLALSSVYFALPYVPSEARLDEREKAQLRHIMEILAAGEPDRAYHALERFLQNVRLPLNRAAGLALTADIAVAEAARTGRTSAPELFHAARRLKDALGAGYPKPAVSPRYRRLAETALRHGLAAEAAIILEMLQPDGPELLDLAHLQARAARKLPLEQAQLLYKALQNVKAFAETAEPSDYGRAQLTRSQILWLHRQVNALQADMQLIEQALKEPASHQARLPDWPPVSLSRFASAVAASREFPAIRIEHARALWKLGQSAHAINTLREVMTATGTGPEYDAALVTLSQIYRELRNPEGALLLDALLRRDSPYRGVAQIVYGRYQLEASPARGLALIRQGLAAQTSVDEPALFGIELRELRDALSAVAENARDAATLENLAGVLGELRRLQPSNVEVAVLLGDMLRRTGDALTGEAEQLRREGKSDEAAKLHDSASGFYYRAASVQVEAALMNEMPDHDSVRQLQQAAENFSRGGFHPKAAEIYEMLAARDERDPLWAYRRIESTRRARELRRALALTTEFLLARPFSEPLRPSVLLERARIEIELGQYEDALRTLAQIDPERLNFTPLSPNPADTQRILWADTLHARGVAGFNLYVKLRPDARDEARLARAKQILFEANEALDEYRRRFVREKHPGFHLAPGSTTLLLAEIAIEDRAFDEAHGFLLDVLQLAEPDELDAVRAASFRLGDVLYLQRKYLQAVEAYDRAVHRFATHDDRLWGHIGKCKALLALGRKPEAKIEFDRATALLEKNRDAYRDRGLWLSEMNLLRLRLE